MRRALILLWICFVTGTQILWGADSKDKEYADLPKLSDDLQYVKVTPSSVLPEDAAQYVNRMLKPIEAKIEALEKRIQALEAQGQGK